MRMIRVINNYLYSEGAWKGAAVLDPDSSCINAVLDRRQGMYRAEVVRSHPV